MKNNPRSSNEASSINLSMKNAKEPKDPCQNKDYNEEKHTLDLLMSPMSPNRIEEHFRNVFKIQRKTYKIRKLLLSKKRRIKILNDKFDWIVFPMLTLLEIDETFKGRDVSLLVVMDTFTGYILHIEWLKERNKEGLLASLEPHDHLFVGVTLVLTDGAPYFPEVVSELCPLAKHQICLIHVMRGLYRLLRPDHSRYKASLKKYQSTKVILDSIKKSMDEGRKRLKLNKQKDKYWKKKRAEKREEYHVIPYQKGILNDFPFLKKINLKMNEIGSYIRADQASIQNYKGKLAEICQSKQDVEQTKNSNWNIYMCQVHHIYDFYGLFHLTNNAYLQKRQNLLDRFPKDNENKIINKIKSLLTTINSLDTVNKADSPMRLTRNYINTNGVESINSKIRPHLDNLRKIQNTEYIEAYFSLLRFKLNLSRPFSGPRKFTSPIERYGYDLRGRTWLDVLVDGLPSGPQYEINSAKLDLGLANPDRVGKCKTMHKKGIHVK